MRFACPCRIAKRSEIAGFIPSDQGSHAKGRLFEVHYMYLALGMKC
jgi:hypothetical protein